jgi:hypothetical protein
LGRMVTAKKTLTDYGLAEAWLLPQLSASVGVDEWRDRAYRAEEGASDDERLGRMAGSSSGAKYLPIKDWGVNKEEYSFSSGEIGRLGRAVPERYLDDRTDLKGTRLKMLCRLGCLPLMDRVGREQRPPWPKRYRVCVCCDMGVVEDVMHFMMECPMHADRRAKLIGRVHQLDRGQATSTSLVPALRAKATSCSGSELATDGRRIRSTRQLSFSYARRGTPGAVSLPILMM